MGDDVTIKFDFKCSTPIPTFIQYLLLNKVEVPAIPYLDDHLPLVEYDGAPSNAFSE